MSSIDAEGTQAVAADLDVGTGAGHVGTFWGRRSGTGRGSVGRGSVGGVMRTGAVVGMTSTRRGFGPISPITQLLSETATF